MGRQEKGTKMALSYKIKRELKRIGDKFRLQKCFFGWKYKDKSEMDCDAFMKEPIKFRSLGKLTRGAKEWKADCTLR